MASKLNKSTNIARKALIVFLIFAISTFLFGFLFGEDEAPIQRGTMTPTPRSPYLASDEKLGKIAYPQITPLPVAPQSAATYSIQDQEVLPNFPGILNVHNINKPREKLGSAAKGVQVAGQLEISSNGRIIADNVTLFQSADTIRSLTYDKLYEKWSYETDITKEVLDPEVLAELRLSSDLTSYQSKGASLLSLLTLSDSYFDKATARASFVNYDFRNKTITSAESARTARFVYIRQSKTIPAADIDINYRAPQGQAQAQTLMSEVRSSDYNQGIVNMIVRGVGESLVPELVSFNYHQLNFGETGRYNALTTRDAFLKLQAGEGFLYWLKLKGTDPFSEHEPLSVLEFKIVANRTTIIYIQPEEWSETSTWTNYLQPFYLFEGTAILTDGREADFATLVPALQESAYLR